MAEKKRRQYTDKERASLVVMLQSEGYPTKKGALAKVSKYSKVPGATLHRWFHEKNNPAPSEDVNEKKFDLRQALQEELEAIIQALPAARGVAEYKDLARALGIITDKIFLLDGKPTARTEHQIIDMDTVKADLRRRVEAGELNREQLLLVTDNDFSLADELFRGAANRVSTGKDRK